MSRSVHGVRDPRLVPLWECAFALFVLVLATGAVLPLLTPQDADATAGIDAPTHPVWFAVYPVVGFLLLRDRARAIAFARRSGLVLAVVSLTFVSALWSEAPSITLERALGLGLTTALGLYLATRYSVSQLLGLLAWALAIVLAASLVTALFLPAYGLDHLHGDAWRGVFPTKNGLGRTAALAAVVWLLRLHGFRGRSLGPLLVVGLALGLLAESGSKTGLVIVGALVVSLVLAPLFRTPATIAVPAFTVGIACVTVAAAWVADHAVTALAWVGSDSTLTGRTELWQAVWAAASEHPWLGWGYGAFWNGPLSPSVTVTDLIGPVPHAHNGFLDLWLDLGLAGVSLVAAALVLALRRAQRSLPHRATGVTLWPLLSLVFFVTSNLTESSLLARNSLLWVLFVAVFAQLGVAARQRARAVRLSKSRELAVPAALHGS